MSQGYLYIATGAKYIKEAKFSAQSLKKYNPTAQITIVTDIRFEDVVFDQIIVLARNNVESWKDGLSFKVNGLLNSPYEMTFFVDTDTFFTANTSELFNILEFYDLLICHSPNDISSIKVNNNNLLGYTPYNTGVMVFNKNNRIDNLLNKWKELYLSHPDKYSSDQPAFMEALLLNDCKIYVLTSVYNLRFKTFNSLPPLRVKILHGRTSNYERLSFLINKNENKHRVWSPYWWRTFKNYRKFHRLKQLIRSTLGQEGFNKIKNVLKK